MVRFDAGWISLDDSQCSRSGVSRQPCRGRSDDGLFHYCHRYEFVLLVATRAIEGVKLHSLDDNAVGRFVSGSIGLVSIFDEPARTGGAILASAVLVCVAGVPCGSDQVPPATTDFGKVAQRTRCANQVTRDCLLQQLVLYCDRFPLENFIEGRPRITAPCGDLAIEHVAIGQPGVGETNQAS